MSNETHSRITSIEEAIDLIHQGQMIILVDDENRENEGDLVVAAEKITPEIVAFMATYGRGLICLTITEEGDGFDYRFYLDCTLTTDRPNGRGLYVASHYAFDDLTFLGKGNSVRAIMRG